MSQRPIPALQWVNDIMLNATNITSGNTIRRGPSSLAAAATQPFQSITDLSSFDYAQLIVALRPSSNTRFTFVPSNNTPSEIYEAHIKNYRSAVSEMGPLSVGVDHQSTSSASPLTIPERLCQGDVAAHTALLNTIYAQRRGIPADYDWVRARQRLEEKEMFPDNRPLGWTSSTGTQSTNDPKRFIEFRQEDRKTYQLLTNATNYLEKSLQKAFSVAPYFACIDTPLQTSGVVQTELFELILLSLGETAEEAARFYPN